MDNIAVFKDTQRRICEDRLLYEKTEEAIRNTLIMDEGFLSSKRPFYPISHINFEENLTLIPAYRFADGGMKTAILNFANPVEPGGGVLRGASAQEEYLCRASNLYPCLTGECAKTFYSKHNEIIKSNQFRSMFLATDTVVYSPQVTFFREEDYYRDMDDVMIIAAQNYTSHWRKIDVITCAAPFFSGSGYVLPNGDLEHLFYRRIKNILEAAIDHDVEALVLGAFGCGAFNNPPDVVAKAFQELLLEERYLHAFSRVAFAVKRTGWYCKNIEAFEMAFGVFPPTGGIVLSSERNKRRFFE